MEFYVSKLKICGYLLIAVGFVVAGIFLIGEQSIKAVIAGWLGIIFFGFGGLVLVWQLLKSQKKAAVIINEQGIHDQRSKTDMIHWDNISRLWVGEVHSQKFLCVETIEPMPGYALASAGNKLLGFPPITIGFNGLSPGLKEALAHIQAVQPAKLFKDVA